MEEEKLPRSKYPICPECGKQMVAGAHMTYSGRISIYCTNSACNYDVPFEKLTTPVPTDEYIEEILRKIYFVKWDRFVLIKNTYQIYGWIDRDDNYKDFIVLAYNPKTKNIGYIKSSIKYTEEIKEILGLQDSKNTAECQRVEHHFDIENSIKLTTNP